MRTPGSAPPPSSAATGRPPTQAWARAVELDPNNFDALFSLGVNLARDGRMDDARPYLERFMQSAPPARYADQRRAVSQLLAGVR